MFKNDRHLNCFAANLIESSYGLSGKTLSNLHTLELRGNKLDSTAGLSSLPNLENLYLVCESLSPFFFVTESIFIFRFSFTRPEMLLCTSMDFHEHIGY